MRLVPIPSAALTTILVLAIALFAMLVALSMKF